QLPFGSIRLLVTAALAVCSTHASAQDFTIQKVVGNMNGVTLNQPTFVTFAPGDDNDLYIAELKSPTSTGNMGRIVRYNRTTQTKSTVIDLTSIATGGDGGIVG